MFPFNTNTPEYAMQAFWNWFAQNEDWIIKGITTNANKDGASVIHAIDQNLRPAFPGYFAELEFLLGGSPNAMEFYFYHRNNPLLKANGMQLGALLPKTLSQRWRYFCDEC